MGFLRSEQEHCGFSHIDKIVITERLLCAREIWGGFFLWGMFKIHVDCFNPKLHFHNLLKRNV